ncbi:MAG: PD-(D/E)XK nuclease family protein [Treponema sp.]|nr:PD-(D/E)XK nuclease family protein [Treponema sp.]
MNIRQVAPGEMGRIIREYLKKKTERAELLFVFPSDVAADSWSEWAAMKPEESGVEAVALDDFTAWDRFKGSYLAGSETEKQCIPALLRKIFVRTIIRENIGKGFLCNIVPSDDAESAYAFTDWLSKIIPSLKLWHEKYEAMLKARQKTEADDKDEENKGYLELYRRYRDFLEKNNFFEPAWLTPEFIERKKTIIIFYPELLEDFSDYEEVFADADNVILVQVPDDDSQEKPKALEYSDSRKELRRTILYLRSLHKKGVRWTDIALSIPDLETYRPYIRRECERYCVPVNIRSGEPLTKNCAGLIFSQINDCYTSHFSYDSVRALLQNEYVPWKEDIAVLKENLIREGNRLRTICSYEDENERVDSWDLALSQVPGDVREREFYLTLKHEVSAICEAKSFDDLHKAWLIFKQRFLSEDFSDEANNILGRCISELNDIIDIEKRYVSALELTVEKPYAFFLNELSAKTYRPQEKLDGISVFPYKLSAAAHIPYQFVIDASQTNLDIPFRKLGFLSGEKRKELLGQDADKTSGASAAFVRLYAKSGDEICFSYARETFSGFAIAHNAVQLVKEDDLRTELDTEDFYKHERNAKEISVRQKQAFADWAEKTSDFGKNQPYQISDELREKITERIARKRHSDSTVVTQKDLSQFYPCPRKWLFSSILKLREDSLDTNLMQPYDMGNLNHKILELFMKKMKGKALPVTNAGGLFDNEEEIQKEIEDFTDKAIHDPLMDFSKSPLVLRALESQAETISQNIMAFLHYLCKEPSRPAEDKRHSKTSIKGFGGFTVLDAEREIALTSEKGLKFYGVIDCLLLDPESDDLAIIDYKNSTAAMPKASELKADDMGLLGDFQMPMYASLVRQPLVAAYFYAIKDNENRRVVDEYSGLTASDKDAGLENIYQYEVFKKRTIPLFECYAEDFVDRVQKGRFEPVVPRKKEGAFVHAEAYSVCSKCSFSGICRTTFTLGEKKIPYQDA